jgi:hypothetical protein
MTVSGVSTFFMGFGSSKPCRKSGKCPHLESIRGFLPSYDKLYSEARCRAVGIAMRYGLEDRGIRSSSLVRVKNFHFSISSIPALRYIQPSMQWIQRAPNLGGKEVRGIKLTAHLQLVARSIKPRSIQHFFIHFHGLLLS